MRDRAKAVVLILVTIIYACAKPTKYKRATSEQHINDIFSRFTKQSAGWASYYGEYPTGTGACSLDPMPAVFTQKGWIKVAAGAPDFKQSLGCGMCLKIEASGKPVAKGNTPLKGTYYAVINDLCGACGQGDLDFYIPGDGKWDISFDAIDCPDVSGSNGNIQYRFTGSNPWYIKLQITNSKQPTAAVEFFKDGKWHCAKRSGDNHFVWSGVGKIDFPLRTRLTSVTGETVGGDIPKLLNGKDQNSGFQYKPFKEANKDGVPLKLPCHGQGELKRNGKADDVTSQGQGSSDSGSSSGNSTNPGPTEKPDKEVTTNKGGGGAGGTEGGTTPAPGGGEKIVKNVEDFCKTKSDGVYGDPTDCQYFIKCSNSKTYRTKCPSGLHWNDKIKNCDYPEKAGCSKEDAKNDSGQQSMLSDATKEIYKGEDKTEEAETKNAKSDAKRPQSQDYVAEKCPSISRDVGMYHHPSDCSKFIMCNGSMATTYRCPDGFLYDSYRNKCRETANVDCGRRRLNHDSASDDNRKYVAAPTESIIEIERKGGNNNESVSYCVGKLDGVYKYRNDCNVFYKCSRGTTRLKRCPEGLMFNEVEEVCDWPNNVHC